jgi:hypothetical protein
MAKQKGNMHLSGPLSSPLFVVALLFNYYSLQKNWALATKQIAATQKSLLIAIH